MDNTIIAAIIGLTGTIIGGLITLFGKDFFEKLAAPKNIHVDIIGLWDCEWYTKGDLGEKTIVEKLYNKDTVEIKKLKGWEIDAEGTQPNGKYLLKGRISAVNVVTLLYEGISKKKSLTGVVILKVSPMGDIMEGHWYGYTREDILQGGKVIWKRSTI
jgi:hypothetical protein